MKLEAKKKVRTIWKERALSCLGLLRVKIPTEPFFSTKTCKNCSHGQQI